VSARPAVVISRRRQHELLRSWPTWAMTSVLLDPAEVAQVRESGWAGTHHRDPGTGMRIVGTPDGLGFGVDDSWHHPAELIPWPEVGAIARAVPAGVRDQLIEFQARWRAHHSAYPRFTASTAAVGCGPVIEGQPLNARQEAYLRELDAFEASGALPAWKAQKAELEAERLGLHARALCADVSGEAGDLLDLLEDEPVTQSAPAAAVDDSRPAISPPTGPGARDVDSAAQGPYRNPPLTLGLGR